MTIITSVKCTERCAYFATDVNDSYRIHGYDLKFFSYFSRNWEQFEAEITRNNFSRSPNSHWNDLKLTTPHKLQLIAEIRSKWWLIFLPQKARNNKNAIRLLVRSIFASTKVKQMQNKTNKPRRHTWRLCVCQMWSGLETISLNNFLVLTKFSLSSRRIRISSHLFCF